IALAWLIFHTGQKHADYGWDSPTSTFQQIEQGNRGSSLSFYNFGFADEKDREAALQKWKQWLEGNELPPAPERELQPVKFTGFVNAVVMQAQQMVDDAELAHLPGLELADRLHVQALLRAAESIERGRNVD